MNRFVPLSLPLLAGFGFLQFNPSVYAQGQQPVRMFESFAPGYQYHVSCRVNITGTLSTPQGKEKQLALVGSSAIEFDERILVEKDRKVDKTIRVYQKMDF